MKKECNKAHCRCMYGANGGCPNHHYGQGCSTAQELNSNITKKTIDERVGELARKWWHETSCPAHSNQMRPESECNCLLGFVIEDVTKAIEEAKAEEREINE